MARRILGSAVLAGALLLPGPARADGEPPEPPPAQASIRGWAAGGASTGSLWNVSFLGAHADGGFAVEHGALTVPVLVDFDLGKTPGGLSAGQLALSGAFSVHADRFRIGGGPEASYFWMTRSRGASAGVIDAVGLGICGLMTLDVIDFGDDRAIALMLRGEAIALTDRRELFTDGSGTLVPRASIAVGARF